MSVERFEWLSKYSGEVIKTKGSESCVKEIYDRVNLLEKERNDVIVFNQFSDFWNYLWHYDVTANAILELFNHLKDDTSNLAGVCLSSGSSGTLGCADAVKNIHSSAKLIVGEAMQSPTLFMNGYGEHQIEGIGDRHVPWIHNARNTDIISCIDSTICNDIFKLFNMPQGHVFLRSLGLEDSLIQSLGWCGVSSIANLCLAIKFSKYYELSSDDIVFTVLTDSSDMYMSRLASATFNEIDAHVSFHASLQGLKTDLIDELTYVGRKRLHNLKYFTWVEQQGKTIEELDEQWYNSNYWSKLPDGISYLEESILNFNAGN